MPTEKTAKTATNTPCGIIPPRKAHASRATAVSQHDDSILMRYTQPNRIILLKEESTIKTTAKIDTHALIEIISPRKKQASLATVVSRRETSFHKISTQYHEIAPSNQESKNRITKTATHTPNPTEIILPWSRQAGQSTFVNNHDSDHPLMPTNPQEIIPTKQGQAIKTAKTASHATSEIIPSRREQPSRPSMLKNQTSSQNIMPNPMRPYHTSRRYL